MPLVITQLRRVRKRSDSFQCGSWLIWTKTKLSTACSGPSRLNSSSRKWRSPRRVSEASPSDSAPPPNA